MKVHKYIEIILKRHTHNSSNMVDYCAVNVTDEPGANNSGPCQNARPELRLYSTTPRVISLGCRRSMTGI